MEGDRGLSRPRSPLHDDEPVERGADDPVLLGLDRRHDVAHAPGPRPAEGVEEGGLAHQHEVVLAGIITGAGGPEGLVVQPEHLPALGQEVTSSADPQRVRRRGPVEGLGHRRPPVDDQRLLFLVGHGDASEVEAYPLAVDPAEAQVHGPEGEAGPPPESRRLPHVALEPAGEGDVVLPSFLVGQGEGEAIELLQAVVGPIDVRLFGGQLRMHGVMPRVGTRAPQDGFAPNCFGRAGTVCEP